ncbi:MAG: hypothetical protein FJX46_04550 [Alphaproteobacteria bacterium]|nr:hypothetical protein [Alphaproteobacteria bacterium]
MRRVLLALTILGGQAWAQTAPVLDRAVIGAWLARDAASGVELTLWIDEQGRCGLDHQLGRCETRLDELTMRGDGGHPATYRYAVDGARMTVSGGDLAEPLAFNRIAQAPRLPDFGPPVTASVPGLVGRWRGVTGEMTIAGDGTLMLEGKRYEFEAARGAMTLTGHGTPLHANYRLERDRLTLIFGERSQVYRRIEAR